MQKYCRVHKRKAWKENKPELSERQAHVGDSKQTSFRGDLQIQGRVPLLSKQLVHGSLLQL